MVVLIIGVSLMITGMCFVIETILRELFDQIFDDSEHNAWCRKEFVKNKGWWKFFIPAWNAVCLLIGIIGVIIFVIMKHTKDENLIWLFEQEVKIRYERRNDK